MKITGVEQHYILQSRWPAIKAKIDKINARLLAEHAPELNIQVSEPEFRKSGSNKVGGIMSVVRVDISRVVDAPIGKIELLAETKVDLKMLKNPISSPIELLARTTVDADSELMLHTTYTTLSNEEEELITGSRKDPCFCDHCQTDRPRIYIYTVRTDEGIKRVGSGCLETFSGFKMQNWQKAYASVNKLLDDAQVISFSEAPLHVVVPVDLLLCEAIETIQARGYSSGYSGEISTGMEAFEELRLKLIESDTLDIPYPEATRAKAKLVKDFIIDSELSPATRANDYYRNLRLLLNFGYATVRQAGLLTSGVISQEKEAERLKEIAKKSVLGNEQFGAEGDKVLLKNLRVDDVYPKETQYGWVTKITMYDEENRMFFWQASGQKDIKKGEIVNLAGTLKEPERYYSNKYEKDMVKNVLTRCTFHTLEEIEELAKKPAPKAKAKRAKSTSQQSHSPAPF
jgi:hypothetical protein